MKTLNMNQAKMVAGGNEGETVYTTPAECRAGQQSGDLSSLETRHCVIETSSGGTYTKPKE